MVWLELVRGAILLDLLARGFEQRADQRDSGVVAIDRTRGSHRRKTAGGRATQQPHHHGFGLIIGGMPQRNRRRTDRLGGVDQKAQSQRARCRLDPGVRRAGVRCYVGAGDRDRQLPFGCGCGDESGIVGGFWAELVIKVGDVEPKLAQPGDLPEHMQQAQRVGAARHGNHDRCAGREQRVPLAECLDLDNEISHASAKTRNRHLSGPVPLVLGGRIELPTLGL